MELVRTMSDHVTDSMNVNGEQGKQVFPSIANMPNLQHLYSPSPTKSHDSGVSLNKSTPHTDFDRLPRLVELSSATTKTDYRREATSIRTARLPKMSSNYGRRKQQEATTTAASTIVDDNTDTANQFNPDPMPYQAKNFRSSTMIRSVPLSRRHQESFGAVGPRLVKTKSVPFHTRPFLWDPVQRTHTSLLIESCQRNKFMEEEVHLEEVRGLKRKREVIPHRIQYTELSVDGATTKMHEKLDYAAELEKIKSVPVLPPECQELYTGRGIKLPPSHSSNKQPPPPPPVVIPMPQPPAMSRTNTFASQTDETKPPPDRDDRQESLKVQPPAKIKRQSTNMKRKDSKRKDSLNDSRESKRDSNSQEKKDRQTKMETGKSEPARAEHVPTPRVEIQTNDYDSAMETETEEKTVTPAPPLPEDRPESEMEIEVAAAADENENTELKPASFSPIKSVSPNPLRSVDLSLHISDERKAELTKTFHKLDTNKDGHITYPEMSSVLPKELSKSQQKYLKEVYEITSASTFFGVEEFMTVMCLCDTMVKLRGNLMLAYDDLDFGSLEHTVIQYVELYSSVDRRQTGSISVDSLQGMLSSAQEKELKERDFKRILRDMDKDSSSTIDKVEYLASIPYFLTYK